MSATPLNEVLQKLANALGELMVQRLGPGLAKSHRLPIRDGAQRIEHAGNGRVEPTDFPFPGRLINDPMPLPKEASDKVDRLRDFAGWQADAANAMVGRLRGLGREPTAADWREEYWNLLRSRSGKPALFATSDLGTRITDDYPNLTWLGPEFKKDVLLFDRSGQVYIRGRASPHNMTFVQAAQRALARFEAEGVTGDELYTIVRLTDGTEVKGNLTKRGEAARRHFEYLRQWSAAKGRDVSDWPEPTAEEAMTLTASEADRGRIFEDAFKQLADPGEFSTREWADVAFKLFESPQMKNGSDAVTRTYIAGAAQYHLGRVPDFPHDIDLLANTMTQEDFVQHLVDYDSRRAGYGMG
ncbi:hypothetical protein [Nocardia testacea]|uniref:Uncharacterized protein n=1 Tax=Nocardia testacea TaxID=248551 RepID=A0ABW7W5N0_9NOCA